MSETVYDFTCADATSNSSTLRSESAVMTGASLPGITTGATVAVIVETGARGPVRDHVLGVTVIMDVLVILAFSLVLNLLAPMRLCDRFLPAMVERGSGHIVNISSIAGWIGSQGLSSYCASKFGLRGFGESLAGELKGTGVHVTNVYPCFSRTAILDSPQYGYEQPRGVPDYLVSDPADVVASIVAGVRRNRRHVFPDRYARVIHYVTRFAPWLVPLLDRRLHAQSIAFADDSGNDLHFTAPLAPDLEQFLVDGVIEAQREKQSR